jgi:DNA-directed RNA polymerase sigma subunit (sigma70/sigma32)
MIKKVRMDVDKKYSALKSASTLHPRYFEVFEFRHGLINGKPHTLKECGEHFGVSSERIRQVEARVLYEMENFGEDRGETA